MRIRELKRTLRSGEIVPAWPPTWIASAGRGSLFPTGEEGVLESVKPHGGWLILTMTFDGREHLGSLWWGEPPTVAEVEAVLRAQLGGTIGSLGDLEVPRLPRV
jgi:hypothetical protein